MEPLRHLHDAPGNLRISPDRDFNILQLSLIVLLPVAQYLVVLSPCYVLTKANIQKAKQTTVSFAFEARY